MTTLLLFGIGAAVASTSGPGLIHPDAAPTPAGQLELAVGAGTHAHVDFLPDHTDVRLEPAAMLSGSWAITDGLRLDLAAGAVPAGTDRDGHTQYPPMLYAGARWVVARPAGIGLAPFADIAKTSVNSGFLCAGLAVEGGGDRLRVDAALPLVERADTALKSGDIRIHGPLWASATFGEVGLTVRAHEHHALRLGLTSIFPNLSWRWSSGRLFGDVVVAALPAGIDPMDLVVGTHLGMRF